LCRFPFSATPQTQKKFSLALFFARKLRPGHPSRWIPSSRGLLNGVPSTFAVERVMIDLCSLFKQSLSPQPTRPFSDSLGVFPPPLDQASSSISLFLSTFFFFFRGYASCLPRMIFPLSAQNALFRDRARFLRCWCGTAVLLESAIHFLFFPLFEVFPGPGMSRS